MRKMRKLEELRNWRDRRNWRRRIDEDDNAEEKRNGYIFR